MINGKEYLKRDSNYSYDEVLMRDYEFKKKYKRL